MSLRRLLVELAPACPALDATILLVCHLACQGASDWLQPRQRLGLHRYREGQSPCSCRLLLHGHGSFAQLCCSEERQLLPGDEPLRLGIELFTLYSEDLLADACVLLVSPSVKAAAAGFALQELLWRRMCRHLKSSRQQRLRGRPWRIGMHRKCLSRLYALFVGHRECLRQGLTHRVNGPRSIFCFLQIQ